MDQELADAAAYAPGRRGNSSETRKDRRNVTMEGLLEVTNAVSNGAISDPQCLFLDWRFATPAQNSNHYYPRNGWSYGFQIWLIHSQSPSEQKPIKNLA